MFKKLAALSTILGVAALLQNKERRERLFSTARGLLDKLNAAAPAQLSPEMPASDIGAGATTRHAATPAPAWPPRNGTY